MGDGASILEVDEQAALAICDGEFEAACDRDLADQRMGGGVDDCNRAVARVHDGDAASDRIPGRGIRLCAGGDFGDDVAVGGGDEAGLAGLPVRREQGIALIEDEHGMAVAGFGETVGDLMGREVNGGDGVRAGNVQLAVNRIDGGKIPAAIGSGNATGHMVGKRGQAALCPGRGCVRRSKKGRKSGYR